MPKIFPIDVVCHLRIVMACCVRRYLTGRSLDELIKMESVGEFRLSWSVKRDIIRQLAEVCFGGIQ